MCVPHRLHIWLRLNPKKIRIVNSVYHFLNIFTSSILKIYGLVIYQVTKNYMQIRTRTCLWDLNATLFVLNLQTDNSLQEGLSLYPGTVFLLPVFCLVGK